MSWVYEWVEGRVALALRLAAGECGGDYPEAVLILGSVSCALAAYLWPGRAIDKVRFVELMVASAPEKASTISTPLLVEYLERTDQALSPFAHKIRMAAGVSHMSVMLDDEVDRPEDTIVSLCPELDRGIVRSHSYAALFYTEVRSPYVHEYDSGTRAASSPMSIARDRLVNYNNRTRVDGVSERVIHMSVPLLAKLTLDAARYVSSIENRPLNRPSAWWLRPAAP
jgi:hypothetical protein